MEMTAQGRSMAAICSALFSAVVISCGAAPGSPGGQAQQVEQAAPPAAQTPPPRRPGGAPPGTERVTLPGGGTLERWLKSMDEACAAAHAQPGCLSLDKHFTPRNRTHPANKCTVDSQSPGIGKKVPVGTRVRLEITCPESGG